MRLTFSQSGEQKEVAIDAAGNGNIEITGFTCLLYTSNGYNASGLFSSFARINYKLMERYLFTFTGRYDGSSMFGSNNRYGFFPSRCV